MSSDDIAFEQLYSDNAARIYALCLRMSGNAANASDLTQEVFLRAWRIPSAVKVSPRRGCGVLR